LSESLLFVNVAYTVHHVLSSLTAVVQFDRRSASSFHFIFYSEQ